MTLLHACFIGHLGVHETLEFMLVEIMNECILLGLIGHFILFVSPDWNQELRQNVGTSAIVLISTLLLINSLVILSVSLKACKRKLELRKMRKEA